MAKRPTWATIVGILGIIFACFGILGAGNSIMMPKMMEMQKEIFSQIEEAQKQAGRSGDSENIPDEEFVEIFDTMEKMWETPEWFSGWSIAFGILKLMTCGFALFAAIWLLQMKPASIKIFYWSAGLNIGLAVLNSVVLVASMSFMAMATAFSGFFGLVANIVLILVVASGNKEAFSQNVSSTL